MKKEYLVLQPPFAEKYTFLVDDMDKNSMCGVTTDIEKVSYNLRLLGTDFNLNREIQTALSDKGISFVYPIGRFVTIIKIRKDEKEGNMMFCDFEAGESIDSIRDMIKKSFSENIFNKWVELQDIMLEEKDFIVDNVILSLTDE